MDEILTKDMVHNPEHYRLKHSAEIGKDGFIGISLQVLSTEMAEGAKRAYVIAAVQDAADQVIEAIQARDANGSSS